tara:strand:+ start:2091 stop:2462 length:372 start_codon:yes stop_codon:yes gene_type:complete
VSFMAKKNDFTEFAKFIAMAVGAVTLANELLALRERMNVPAPAPAAPPPKKKTFTMTTPQEAAPPARSGDHIATEGTPQRPPNIQPQKDKWLPCMGSTTFMVGAGDETIDNGSLEPTMVDGGY